MDEKEARARFAAARVARLATVRPDGGPHLVPVVFVLEGERSGSWSTRSRSGLRSEELREALMGHRGRAGTLTRPSLSPHYQVGLSSPGPREIPQRATNGLANRWGRRAALKETPQHSP
jgi:hypothetical protein